MEFTIYLMLKLGNYLDIKFLVTHYSKLDQTIRYNLPESHLLTQPKVINLKNEKRYYTNAERDYTFSLISKLHLTVN